jgi:hypothetical protein
MLGFGVGENSVVKVRHDLTEQSPTLETKLSPLLV